MSSGVFYRIPNADSSFQDVYTCASWTDFGAPTK